MVIKVVYGILPLKTLRIKMKNAKFHTINVLKNKIQP